MRIDEEFKVKYAGNEAERWNEKKGEEKEVKVLR